MPYVNIKITREGDTTSAQKAALIGGVTDLLKDVLGKSPASTFVVIDEVDLESWGLVRGPTGRAVPSTERLVASDRPRPG